MRITTRPPRPRNSAPLTAPSAAARRKRTIARPFYTSWPRGRGRPILPRPMRTAACLLLLAAPGSLPAQQPATLRVAAATAPIPFNGRLDNRAWAAADSIVDFRQREPVVGAPATERTVVKVLRDADA